MTVGEWLHSFWAFYYLGIPAIIFIVGVIIAEVSERRDESKANHPSNYRR